MNIPEELKYTEEHEWVRIEDNIAVVGITDFAQGELGDIVYLEIDTLDSQIDSNQVFGTVEAVKTVSDLFMPIAGRVIEVNPSLEDKPELVNDDPYGEGWIIKIDISEQIQIDNLLSPSDYKNLIDS
ncbi:MAG: glycine cleavage system protein GcvH [Candidatus Marisimplicoccus sp.]